MREIEEAALGGDQRSRLALEVFSYRVRKYIGAYFAVLGRIDALVFTGGIGEKSASIRRWVVQGLEGLGLELDRARNRAVSGGEGEISAFDSRVRVLVVPTNEELVIAQEVREVLSGGGQGG